MTALAVNDALLSVERYLAGEERSEVKHEYLAGVPHAMAGASLEHNTIAFALSGILYAKLKGSNYTGFGSDMKLKLQLSATAYFYYPDAMIVCGGVGLGPSWCEAPRVIFEVLSEATRMIDEREKRMAYLTLPSLDAYVRIEQDQRLVVVDRRAEGEWSREVLRGPDAMLRLPTVNVEFPIAELYERLNLP